MSKILNSTLDQTRICIIGAGPIGIQMAVLLQSVGLKYSIFEKGQIGQTIFNWPENTRFHSSPDHIKLADQPFSNTAFERLTREEYLNHLRNVVSQNHIKINLFEEVIEIEKLNGLFYVESKTETGLYNKNIFTHVIFSFGSYHKQIIPRIPGISRSRIKSANFPLHYVFSRKVIIIGGRHSALEYAIRASRVGASEITIVCRQNPFLVTRLKVDVLDDLRKLMQAGKIILYESARVVKVNCNTCYFEDNEKKSIAKEFDFIISACGFAFDSSLFDKINLVHDKNGKPALNEHFETSLENCYVIGTAVAGAQISNYDLFIENTLYHANIVLKSIQRRHF